MNVADTTAVLYKRIDSVMKFRSIFCPKLITLPILSGTFDKTLRIHSIITIAKVLETSQTWIISSTKPEKCSFSSTKMIVLPLFARPSTNSPRREISR